jgi:hypothetical protein
MHIPHMNIPHPQIQFSEVMWSSMALLGVLAMAVFEAVAMRLLIGKW